jgi:hypothetical protein
MKPTQSCRAFYYDEALQNRSIGRTPQSADALSRPEIYQQMAPVQQPSLKMKHSRKDKKPKAIPMETMMTALPAQS